MKYFVYRNTTIEHLFDNKNFKFSGYDDISHIDLEAENIMWFYLPPIKANVELISKEVESFFSKIELVYNNYPKNKSFIILSIANLFNINAQSSDFSLNIAINEINLNILNFAKEKPNVKVLDFSEFLNKYSLEQIIDWKYYFLSNMVINPAIATYFKKWFNTKINEFNLIRKKCLVLDLDNTLWGGILGEDGINGIKIGGSYPGNSFQFFQESILEMAKNGVILAICSKNNESDVLELWEKNPHMILKREHFAAYKINWNNKAVNIKQIAEELNIGLDSLVFLDDNPSERDLVRSLLPNVTIPEFPKQPYKLIPFINDICKEYFVAYKVTEEDKNKTEQYIANSKRNDEFQKFTSINEYLKNLELELFIEHANEFNISRISQMTQKTNQFNLTTKRYSESEILTFIANGGIVYSLRIKDKFGDQGITGCILIRYEKFKEGEVAVIDTFLLSCRILGKGIENAFLIKVLKMLQKKNIKVVNALYIPTQKNNQVKDFYDKNLFTLVSDINNIRNYTIDHNIINQLKINTDIYKITIIKNESQNT